ncbi:MAG TPA: FtsX-like permease family protein [Bacteroidota bacterium]|nr:FtsX-like permease family protein [Bacteroidota bacterium]
MKVLKLVLKNLLRHKLRTFLTVLGLSCAVFAFGFLRTIVSAWNSGVASSSSVRLITRHAVSFVYPLPLSYKEQIEKVPGVTKVSYAYWFQGVYKDQSFDNFFPRYAVDAEQFLSMYPEFVIPPDQLETFKKERNACIVGRKIMEKYGWKIGDVIPIEGDIYPGHWQFVIRGVYTGKDKTVDETQMFLQWSYLDESLKQTALYRSGQVGWYAVQIANANDAATVSENIDALFANSPAKTKTETEKAFQQSFVSLSSAILTSLEVVSYVIIGIILLVLANTIIMSARERIREYAVLKTLGFNAGHIIGLVTGESLVIAMLGGCIGIALTFPMAAGVAAGFPTMFPIFNVEPSTIILSFSLSFLVGLLASVFPAIRSSRIKIVDGLRQIG